MRLELFEAAKIVLPMDDGFSLEQCVRMCNHHELTGLLLGEDMDVTIQFWICGRSIFRYIAFSYLLAEF